MRRNLPCVVAVVLSSVLAMPVHTISPGPPENLQLDFAILSLAHPPNPIVPPSPNLPVYFRDFSFAQELGQQGTLLAVTASFN